MLFYIGYVSRFFRLYIVNYCNAHNVFLIKLYKDVYMQMLMFFFSFLGRISFWFITFVDSCFTLFVWYIFKDIYLLECDASPNILITCRYEIV